MTGKPLPFFADLLKAGMEKAGDGPFVIGNADLILKPGTKDLVAQLGADEIMFSRRIDIDDMDHTEGAEYAAGFDLFAINGRDAARLADTQLIFGAPWWDHYLPLMMHMKGGKLRLIEPAVFHLAHEERWDWPLWTRLGQTFLGEIEQAATAPYKESLGAAKKGPWLGWRRFIQQTLLQPLAREEKTIAALHRVSHLNVAYLDEHASPNHA